MYVSCLLFHAIRGKIGQVEQELGKLRGWLLRRLLPAREYSTPIFCVRAPGLPKFQRSNAVPHPASFYRKLKSGHNGMYLLSDSWPRFARPSGSCGAEHPVFEIRGKKFCSSASAM
jgi:hypothetical protein